MRDRDKSVGTVQNWRTVKKLLAIRLDSLGDVLMTSPAFAALKESLGCHITLLTSPSGATVAAYIREVDETIVYEAPWMKATDGQAGGESDRAMIERLRQEEFDAAVIFSVYSQNPLPAAMMCYLADIPRRLAHCRENPYHLLTDWVKEPEPEQFVRHEVQRHLDLVASIGCVTIDARLRFHLARIDQEYVSAMLSNVGVNSAQPFVVVHPGATAPSRRYPPEKFADVVRGLGDEGLPVVFTGSQGETELVDSIQDAVDTAGISLAGKLTLGQFGALLEASSLLVSNNSGPVHLAAAIGTPVVDLYALTNPQHTPWMVPNITLSYNVPCRFCYKSVCPLGHHDCLQQIDPAWVVAAAKTLLKNEDVEQFFRSVPEARLFQDFPGLQTAGSGSGTA